MDTLCKYKNVFGAPNTGIHSYRIFNIAIVDALAVFIIAILITILWYKKSKSKKDKKYHTVWVFVITLIILFLLGIFAHWLFCVDTTVHKYLFT
jgi:energy-coupling factor transporter transmembrane protein EcfT